MSPFFSSFIGSESSACLLSESVYYFRSKMPMIRSNGVIIQIGRRRKKLSHIFFLLLIGLQSGPNSNQEVINCRTPDLPNSRFAELLSPAIDWEI